MSDRGSTNLLTTVIGVGAATCALFSALTVVGPTFRLWFGYPLDFNADYTSREAFLQALTVQGISLGMTFLLVGLITRARGSKSIIRWSLWISNPISIGLGYLLYRLVMSLNGPWEYFSYQDWAAIALLGPLFLAPCAISGAYVGRHVWGTKGRA